MQNRSSVEGYGETVPPSWQHVTIYFDQKGLLEKVANDFFQYYETRNWETEKGYPIRNWKVTASNWIWMHQRNKR
jgi:hypothetical protein